MTPTILEGYKEMRNDKKRKQEFTENFGSTSVGKWDKKFEKVEEIDNIHNKQLNRARDTMILIEQHDRSKISTSQCLRNNRIGTSSYGRRE